MEVLANYITMYEFIKSIPGIPYSYTMSHLYLNQAERKKRTFFFFNFFISNSFFNLDFFVAKFLNMNHWSSLSLNLSFPLFLKLILVGHFFLISPLKILLSKSVLTLTLPNPRLNSQFLSHMTYRQHLVKLSLCF